MAAEEFEDVLRFWFSQPAGADPVAMTKQMEWWFRGGADAAISERFVPLLERAARGDLDRWSQAPRSRLALIIVLDQFSRSAYRETPRAYAQDEKARFLTLDGLDIGHYAALETAWEKKFFVMPLGHSEQLEHLDAAVRLAEELAEESSPEFRALLERSASQTRGHRDVVARFGRQPHRNAVLGRPSTPDEHAYLAKGEFVHTRPVPPRIG